MALSKYFLNTGSLYLSEFGWPAQTFLLDAQANNPSKSLSAIGRREMLSPYRVG
jgi:hypothetical protein